MKVTGERVSTRDGGFNPTFQRHVAAYAAAAERLDDGIVLDLGCGTGHSYELLAPRETVGVDREPAALRGQGRRTVVADMRALPFAGGTFASVVSVHSIEHVPDPQRVLAEVRRVLASPGTAVFVTPNRLTFGRPDEIIDPYHDVEYDPAQLRELCVPFFDTVEILGLFGSQRYGAIVAAERAELDALLARDPLRLRRLVPVRLRRRLYDAKLRQARKRPHPAAAEIECGDFHVGGEELRSALDLIAVCRTGAAGP